MVLLRRKKWLPELKKEKHLNDISSYANGQIQNNFTEIFLGWPSTKIAKMVLLRWTKWPPKIKIEKPLNNISLYANGQISK